jgi:hypothetical protein
MKNKKEAWADPAPLVPPAPVDISPGLEEPVQAKAATPGSRVRVRASLPGSGPPYQYDVKFSGEHIGTPACTIPCSFGC